MRNILSAEHRELLEQYAWSNVLLGLDYDGTIAPIVPRPEQAAMRSATRTLLEDVTAMYPCVVISGRTREDVAGRMRGVGFSKCTAIMAWSRASPARSPSHWFGSGDALSRATCEGGAASRSRTRPCPSPSTTVGPGRRRRPERRSSSPRSALDQARIIGGKQVVNVLPQGAGHKGMAMERAREKWGCDTAIYVGDDETDEDVFAVGRPGRLLTIRVGAKRRSLAAYCIRDQRQIDALLRILVDVGRRRLQIQGAGA